MKFKIETLELKSPLHLLQTNLIVNTTNVFVCENVEFYKTTCNQGVVIKDLFDINGDDVYVFGLKVNSKLRKELKLK